MAKLYNTNEYCLVDLQVVVSYPRGLAFSWNDTLGTNPVSDATVYSTVIKRPSGSHTEYFPVT